jgi:hypothetical protein
MLENDMIRAIIDERIAQAAVLRRPAAPAPITPGRVRVWGPRASMRPSPATGGAPDDVMALERRDLPAATEGELLPAGSVQVAAVPGPRQPIDLSLDSGRQVVDA